MSAAQDILTLEGIAPERVLLVTGASRSGTTWLGKIFDSHPDVLYRHDPDNTLDIDGREGAEVRDIVGHALLDNSMRAVGKLPLFAKSYRSPMRQVMYAAFIHVARTASRLSGSRSFLRQLRVPGFVDPGKSSQIRIVVKSVRSRGFARMMTTALPGCRVIVIIRDPCGHVASMMRGVKMGKFSSPEPIDEDIASELALECGENRAWAEMSEVDHYAWNWAASVRATLDELRGYASMKIVLHHDLCVRPNDEMRTLFSFAGLSWQKQTDRFVKRSSSLDRHGDYYGVYRRSSDLAAMDGASLSPEERLRIMAIVEMADLKHLVQPTTR